MFVGAEPGRGANANLFADWSYDFQNNGTIDLPGRLYVPSNPGPSPALVIFFHGISERGTNNTSQVNGNIDNLFARAQSEKFFLYAPQAPHTVTSWTDGLVKTSMMMAAKAVAEHGIDPARIYVTGLSMGGGGTWVCHSLYPDVIAASVPICGASGGTFHAAGLAGKPVWAFHARDDSTVNVAATRNRINAIRNAEAPPLGSLTFPLPPYYADGSGFYDLHELRYTEFVAGGHGIWSQVYGETAPGNPGITYVLYDWLLAKTAAALPPQAGEVMLFDFGSDTLTTLDSQQRRWNSTGWGTEVTLAPAIPFAVTSAGRGTFVTLDVIDAFGGPSTQGVTAGSMYDLKIAKDAWAVGSASDLGIVRIRGLEPGGHYQLKFFASQSTSDGSYGRRTRYQVGAQHADLDVYNNLSTQAVLEDVTADGAGVLEVQVMPQPGTASRSAHLGALELSWVAGAAEPPPAALYFQDFNGAADLASYAAAEPTTGQVNDIGQEANGGTWSLHEGALRLVRAASAAPSNGAGFTRFAVPVEEAPRVAVLNFRVAASGTPAGYQTLGTFTLGQINSVGDYSGTAAYSLIANDVSLKTNGGGATYGLNVNGTVAGSYPLDGSWQDVSYVLNYSSSAVTYEGPDAAAYPLAAGKADLWVNGIRTHANAGRTSGFLSNAMGGFRFHSNTTQAVTLRFDDIELVELADP